MVGRPDLRVYKTRSRLAQQRVRKFPRIMFYEGNRLADYLVDIQITLTMCPDEGHLLAVVPRSNQMQQNFVHLIRLWVLGNRKVGLRRQDWAFTVVVAMI